MQTILSPSWLLAAVIAPLLLAGPAGAAPGPQAPVVLRVYTDYV